MTKFRNTDFHEAEFRGWVLSKTTFIIKLQNAELVEA